MVGVRPSPCEPTPGTFAPAGLSPSGDLRLPYRGHRRIGASLKLTIRRHHRRRYPRRRLPLRRRAGRATEAPWRFEWIGSTVGGLWTRHSTISEEPWTLTGSTPRSPRAQG